jgi:O-antigen/teichoic acid export membrane protein
MSSSVAPRRTGLVVFVARIFSVFTGFLFLIMVTRVLTPADFGLWEYILDIVVFASFPAGLITYWATRGAARGEMIGRTTQALCLLLSLVGFLLYVGFAFGTSSVVDAPVAPLLVAMILVPLTYWTLANQALVQGYNPAFSAYSLIVSEPAKLLVAYPLLYVLNLGINGVIISFAVSYFVQAAVSTYQLSAIRKDKVDLSKGKEWLKLYHVPSVWYLTQILTIADTFVASVGAGGTNITGFFQAGFQVATLVGYSQFLSIALYPLLLRRESDRITGKVLEFSLMFGVPMAAGAIALAPQILYLLKPVYTESSTILVLLSLAAVADLVSTVFDRALMGKENADLASVNKSGRIIRSDLMFVSASNFGGSAVYLCAVFLIAEMMPKGSPDAPAVYATYWALAQLVFMAALVGVKLRRVRARMPLSFTRPMLWYVVSSAAMAATLYLVGGTAIPAGLGTIDSGLRLLGLVGLGGAVYFGVLYLLDADFRGTARAALSVLLSP